MTTVTLTRLSHYYGKNATRIAALQDVSLAVASGELLAVLGPSGCGKTTLLRLIAGLQQPTTGDIQFDGVSVTGLAAQKRGVMMVFQDEQLFPYMTVFQNVAFGLKSQGLHGRALRQRVSETLELVQMCGYEKRLPSQLSGGEQQRIALARAIAIRPRVLLLDEPLSHLDTNLREQLRGMIRDIQRHLKSTMVLVTHDQAEALSIADRVALLIEGRLQQLTTPETLVQNPDSEAIARFLGVPNILEGHKQGASIRTAFGELKCSDWHSIPDGMVRFAIPTTAVLLPSDEHTQSNCFTAEVIVQHRQGSVLRYTLKLGATILYMDRLRPCATDTTLYINIDPKQIQVFR